MRIERRNEMSKIKGFIGETLVYGFGNVFSRLFAMFLIPLYAAYLGKIDYSNLIMLQSVFTILTFLLALNAGVFYYYYEYENIKYKKIVFTSWFYYQLTITILITIAMVFASRQLFQLFIVNDGNESIIRYCLILVALQLFPYMFNATNMNYFRIDRKPKKVVQIVLLEAIFTIIFVSVSLALLKQGLIAVLVSQILARSIVSIIFSKHAAIYIHIRFFSAKLLRKIYAYTWPFVLSSIFTWVIVSIDKFIGASELIDKTEVALLSLSMQLVLPIAVLADMIRMAVGPYVMSIRKDADAEKSYQQIFDLVVFASAFVMIGLIIVSPYLTLILADSSYINVIYVIPLMAFAKVLSMISSQLSISFSLVKKNTFILYSIIIGGVLGVVINSLFMKDFGFIVSGYSQIVSYSIMCVFLFFTGRKYAKQKLNLTGSGLILGVVLVFLVGFYYFKSLITSFHYLGMAAYGTFFIFLIIFTYFRYQKLKLSPIINSIIKLRK